MERNCGQDGHYAGIRLGLNVALELRDSGAQCHRGKNKPSKQDQRPHASKQGRNNIDDEIGPEGLIIVIVIRGGFVAGDSAILGCTKKLGLLTKSVASPMRCTWPEVKGA